jgi:hypothetical protein
MECPLIGSASSSHFKPVVSCERINLKAHLAHARHRNFPPANRLHFNQADGFEFCERAQEIGSCTMRQPRKISDGLWAFIPDDPQQIAILRCQKPKQNFRGLKAGLRRVCRSRLLPPRNGLHFLPDFLVTLDPIAGHGSFAFSSAIPGHRMTARKNPRSPDVADRASFAVRSRNPGRRCDHAAPAIC